MTSACSCFLFPALAATTTAASPAAAATSATAGVSILNVSNVTSHEYWPVLLSTKGIAMFSVRFCSVTRLPSTQDAGSPEDEESPIVFEL